MPRLVIHLRDPRPVWSVPEWAVEAIRAEAPPSLEVVVVDAPADGRGDGGSTPPEAVAAVESAEIYLGFGFPPPLFEAAMRGGQLRWVHSASAGVGGALYPAMVASDVTLTNSAGTHAEPMGESVIAMMLYFARGFDFAVRAQRERRWDRAPFDDPETPVREIAGAMVGVVGFGGIGRAVARRARALGMEVLAYRRTPGSEEGVEMLTGPTGLDRLLAVSDYVVLSLPHTPETAGLLDARRIGSLRAGAVLINVGRGELLDEAALIVALREGRIRGVGLDVFQEEPLPEGSPFWTLPNVLVTPHVSATTHGFWRRETELIVENLRRYGRGEPLLNQVDKQAGY